MLNDSVETTGPMFTNNTSAAFALSRDLGIIRATQDPIVWFIGNAADPAVTYTDLTGVPQQRSLYYKTRYLQDEYGMSLVGIHIHH